MKLRVASLLAGNIPKRSLPYSESCNEDSFSLAVQQRRQFHVAIGGGMTYEYLVEAFTSNLNA